MSENGIKKNNIRLSRKKKLEDIGLPNDTTQNDISNVVLDILHQKYAPQNDKLAITQLLQKLDDSQTIMIKNNNDSHAVVLHKIDKIYELLHIEADKDDDFIMVDDKKLKHQAVLGFLNALLASIDRKAINNIKEFKDVPRDDLLSDKCKKIMEEHIEKLVKAFGKTNMLYGKKDIVEYYILTALRKIIQLCGSKLIVHQKKIAETDGKYYTKTLYSVQ